MIFIEILPSLWIGNYETLKHKDRLNIDYIINCTKDLHFLGKSNNYKSDIKINLEKYEIIKMYEYLIETTEFIYKKIMNNNSVLVVCQSGNQLSPTVITAFIIKYGRLNINTIIKSLRTKHKTAFFPSIDFKNSLEMVESNFLSN